MAMIYEEIVDLTLPGGSTPSGLAHTVLTKVSALEFTEDGVTRQVGVAANFRVMNIEGVATLTAKIFSDTAIDFADEEFFISGLAVGNLIAVARDQTLLLPLLF